MPLNPAKVLDLKEVRAVLADLHRRKARSFGAWQNLALFRLSCCCGLRRKEICGLRIGDLYLQGFRPAIRLRAETTKGERESRTVPLWWDRGTLEDLVKFRNFRQQIQMARSGDPVMMTAAGHPFQPQGASRRWRTAIHCLPPDRVRQLPIHAGRATYATLSLAAGRSLVEIQRAMGHRNIATTHEYLHLVCREGIPDVFAAAVD